MGEAYTKQNVSSSPQIKIDTPSQPISSTQSSQNETKPFLCAFCPYFAHNIQEFQTHIAKHTEKNFRCLLCNCM